MKKAPLYSRSRRTPPAGDPARQPAAAASEAALPPASAATEAAASSGSAPAAGRPGAFARLRALAGRHERLLWVAFALALFGTALAWKTGPVGPKALTPAQIDHVVRQSIEEKPLTAPGLKAYEKILPSVVRVVGYGRDDDDAKPGRKPPPDHKSMLGKAPEVDEDGMVERGVGTGVVIVDNGTILTNLHVVLGAEKVKVTFADGLESVARVVNVMAEHDLAVLRAQKIPDDLNAATMRSTADLAPGERVMAVGFPFGIGPSASEGIVSGLKREFRSPEGEKVLTNLIQFDAAANPGNSGGPLVTMDGEVVGIVTAILNPARQRVFIGIGFAVPIESAAQGAGLPPF